MENISIIVIDDKGILLKVVPVDKQDQDTACMDVLRANRGCVIRSVSTIEAECLNVGRQVPGLYR